MTGVDWRAYFTEQEEDNLEELYDFLRIPSISALPANAVDVRTAAEWVAARMKTSGIPEVEVLETGGHPLVYGKWHVDDNKPTALIYAHYEVQPPDPLDLYIALNRLRLPEIELIGWLHIVVRVDKRRRLVVIDMPLAIDQWVTAGFQNFHLG